MGQKVKKSWQDFLSYFKKNFLLRISCQNRLSCVRDKKICLILRNVVLKQVFLKTRLSFFAVHPLIAESLNNLGFCQIQSEDYTHAHVNLKEANAMHREIYGNNHLLVAISSENLAKCLCNLNQGNRALDLVQQALEIKKASVDEVNNSGIAKTLAIIGLAFEKTDHFQEAEKFYLESMRMTKVVFGPNHPNIAEILFSLSELLIKQERKEEAENYSKEAELMNV